MSNTADANAARQHFDVLSRVEQEAAVRRMAAEGMTDHTIAAASGWSVEMVRVVLAEPIDGARR